MKLNFWRKKTKKNYQSEEQHIEFMLLFFSTFSIQAFHTFPTVQHIVAATLGNSTQQLYYHHTD